MTRDQFSFFHPFRIRYSEIDGQGVVFNAHYLTFYDTIHHRIFSRARLRSIRRRQEDRHGLPRREIRCGIQITDPLRC